MRQFSPENSGYSGRQHEADLFGRFDTSNPAYKEALEKLMVRRGDRYVSHKDSLELVQRFSKEDPTNPKKDLLRDLRLEIIDALDDEKVTVEAYSALGTPLDVFHGIDAFLIIKQDGKETVITLDATLREKKLDDQEGAKADILIRDIPSPEFEETKYLATVQDISTKILKVYKRQRENNTSNYSSQRQASVA